MEKPVADGGAGVGTTVTSLILLVLLALGICYQILTRRKQTRELVRDEHAIDPAEEDRVTGDASRQDGTGGRRR